MRNLKGPPVSCSSLMWKLLALAATWLSALVIEKAKVEVDCKCSCEVTCEPCSGNSWLVEVIKAVVFLGIGAVWKVVWGLGNRLWGWVWSSSCSIPVGDAKASPSGGDQALNDEAVRRRAREQLQLLRSRRQAITA